MSIITARGSQISFNNKVDLKKVYIRPKENESVRIRIVGLTDYIEYKAHASFQHKVYTQPCIEPAGRECPLCKAGKSGVDTFDALYAKKRYLFAFADIDTGELRVWECSKPQARDMLAQIAEYKDDINETAFNLKRTGNKTETSYKLNPILKMKGDDVEKFHRFDDVTVEETFFEEVLVPKSEKMMLDILNGSGFPMEKFFPEYSSETAQEDRDETAIF